MFVAVRDLLTDDVSFGETKRHGKSAAGVDD
jgi:hypothetical protein